MLYGYYIWSDVQVKNDDDLHEGHPKIIKVQIVNHAIWHSNFVRSRLPVNQVGDNHVLNRGQMLTEVKRSKVSFTTTSLGLKHHQTIKMVTSL